MLFIAAGCGGLCLLCALIGIGVYTLLNEYVDPGHVWARRAAAGLMAALGVIAGSAITWRLFFKPVMTGDDIVRRRQSMGLSRSQLARYLNVKEATLGRWEMGEARIPRWLPSHLDVLAELGPIKELEP